MMPIKKFIDSLNFALTENHDEVNKRLRIPDALDNLTVAIGAAVDSHELPELIEILPRIISAASVKQNELKQLLLKARAARRRLDADKYLFMPMGVNALKYETGQGALEPVFIEVAPWKGKRFDFRFPCSDSLKTTADRAYQNCLPLLHNLHKLNNAKPDLTPEKVSFIVHARDFPGEDTGDDFLSIDFGSMGLALAIGLYFNYHLFCASSDKRDHLRKVFEDELEKIAFTGELDDGRISRISGFAEKFGAAEQMGMKRVFCPAENKDDASSRRAAIIQVSSLEQAIALVRYGQYLENIRKDKTKLPAFFIEDRDFLEMRENPQHGSMTAMPGLMSERVEFIKRLVKQPELLNQLDKGFLVTGDGGIGKSTFLRYLRRHYAAQILDGKPVGEYKNEIKIPVFIDLRGYKKGMDIKTLLSNSIVKESENYTYLLQEDIEQEMLAGMFLLLCDGIDGIDREVINEAEKEIRDIKDNYPANFFVFTSRENVHLGYISNLRKMELAELRKEDIGAIIDKAFEDNNERAFQLKTLLEQHPSGIEGNPFFLSLMVEDVKRHSDADINISHFRNKGKLFERIVAARYEKDSSGKEASYITGEMTLIKAFKKFIPGLAAWLMMKNKTSFTENDIALYCNETGRDAAEFMKCLQTPRLIPVLELLSPDHWGFIHDRFLEYFAAVHQKDEFLKIVSNTGRQPTSALADYLQEYINKTRWEDVNLLTVGLLVDCEVESGKIHCKCDQSGFFCAPPLKDGPLCRRFSVINETFSLAKRQP